MTPGQRALDAAMIGAPILGGAAIGAGTGALTSDEGERAMGALRGAGAGALGGALAAVPSTLLGAGAGRVVPGWDPLVASAAGYYSSGIPGGLAGGYLARKTSPDDAAPEAEG